MATYYKPQSPIKSGEDFIYPITTADQIMKSDNSRRLEQAGLIVADNSTSLGGVVASKYALKTDAVPISGGTMTGDLKTTQLRIRYNGNYPKIIFYSSENERIGDIQDNADSKYRRFSFAQYHSDQDGKSTKYCDSYQLPTASAGLTNDAYYSILTSKNPVTISQGGTNATTASAALTNLGALAVDGTAANSSKLEGKTLATIKKEIYPVGAIYISTSSTSPASLFGGTWEQLKDRFLLGAGSSYTAGDTGGNATHTLTIEQIPSHYHEEIIPFGPDFPRPVASSKKDDTYTKSTQTTNGIYKILKNDVDNNSASNTYPGYPVISGKTGSGKAHNNMPPYLVVYMWKRVS